MTFTKTCVAAVLAAMGSTAAMAQTIPSAPTFPNQQKALADAYMNSAREIAGGDQDPAYLRRCILAQAYSQYSSSSEARYLMPPIQVFDNLYWAGQGGVNAWALKTSAGLVLIDALNNAAEARDILVPGLQALGLNIADAKYLIVTHEHGDHFGGAKYLQDTYGVQVIATAAAWSGMTGSTAPARNITVEDMETLTFGDTSILFVSTPGHTNGAVSTVFPVFDHGARRSAAMYGGFGIPGNVANKTLQLNSLARFSEITAARSVDTLLANHQTQDLSLFNHDLLRHRRPAVAKPQSPADFKDPHPYVVGSDQWQRFLTVQSQCVRLAAARNNQTLPD